MRHRNLEQTRVTPREHARQVSAVAAPDDAETVLVDDAARLDDVCRRHAVVSVLHMHGRVRV